MKNIKIAIIREEKTPKDKRTPLTPIQAAEAKASFQNVDVVCQSSEVRCYSDDEYKEAGIDVVDEVNDCDILLGVKEVPVERLIPEKTYLIFSHTIKKQSYNRGLLQEILKKNIRLIDYERLTDENNQRIIAFGRWAGIVGTYNAFHSYGQKFNLFNLKRAHQHKNLDELMETLKAINLPPIKIIITGNGRVAKGGLEILKALGIKQVEPAPYFYQTFDQPVFTQVDVNSYYVHKKNHPFHFDHFFKHPEQYISAFLPFTHHTDILINAVFWDPKAPKLFTPDDMKREDFNIKVIADITCDIDGSIPSTIRATTIDDPVYDFDPYVSMEKPPFSAIQNISVMAIDNLPNELPRDASEDFGNQLIDNVLPYMVDTDSKGIIERATITRNGQLTTPYNYLRDYVDVHNS